MIEWDLDEIQSYISLTIMWINGDLIGKYNVINISYIYNIGGIVDSEMLLGYHVGCSPTKCVGYCVFMGGKSNWGLTKTISKFKSKLN